MSALKVYGIVRLTRDPEMKANDEKTIVKFSGAANEKYKDVEKSHFYNFCAFGKQGEIVMQYFKKGSRIFINGELKMSKWQDKEGKSQTTYEVVIDSFEFVDKKSDAPAGAGESEANSLFPEINGNLKEEMAF